MRSAVAGYCLSDVEDGGPFYCCCWWSEIEDCGDAKGYYRFLVC